MNVDGLIINIVAIVSLSIVPFTTGKSVDQSDDEYNGYFGFHY